MKLVKKIGILSVFLTVFMAGCFGTKKVEDITHSTIIVNKDNSVSVVYVEDFSKGYYSESEVRTQIDDEIAKLNSAAGETVATVDSFAVENGVAKLNITFTRAEYYNLFDSEDLYVGTVSDALNAGYDLDVTLRNYDDTETVGYDQLSALGENHIVIIDNGYNVVVPSNFLYVSEDVDNVSKKEVNTFDNADHTVVIYK